MLIAVFFSVGKFVDWFGDSHIQARQSTARRMSLINMDVLQLELDTQQIRQSVDQFVETGHESFSTEVERCCNEVLAKVGSDTAKNADAEIRNRYEKIGAHLRTYLKNFEMVVAEREIRKSLRDKKFQSITVKFFEQIELTRTEIGQSSETTFDNRGLSDCEAAIRSANLAFLSYFDTPDSTAANKAISSILEAKTCLSMVQAAPDHAERLEKLIEEYTVTGMRMVHATRSYLYLRNVVMAGEQSEISFYARGLRELAAGKLKQINIENERKMASTRIMVRTINLAAGLASVLVAVSLAYKILPPITRLTSCFERLSDGESVDSIPGEDRPDEIGKMARAATVFRDSNNRTRELLEETRLLNSELERKSVELKEKNDELDDFAYVASHDLKSPLRGIRQLAQWINEDARDRLESASQKHIDQLLGRVGKLESLLDDLLDFSRVATGDSMAEMVDLGELIEDAVEMLDNPHEINIQYDIDVPQLKITKVQFEQVVLNLVGNAIKHNDKEAEGCIRIHGRVTEENELMLSVADNGPGIHPGNHDRVFQMYQRVGDAQVEGSGMGLAIVRKQVRKSGGDIHVESDIGMGAVFELSWPVEIECVENRERELCHER
ncbi:Phytochrome-like protein cph1 [Mariniblastus fucicola]|uniref:histidine kinase n=2 Tax=Mariniblastus fucicola TaxID=980251 RepID=A0A5B9PGF1_9BACT|nr:Phytochrome-like protein cph1 [Mariniblastus fucicola]